MERSDQIFKGEPGECVNPEAKMEFEDRGWSSKPDPQGHSITTWEVTEMQILKPHSRLTELSSVGGAQ